MIAKIAVRHTKGNVEFDYQCVINHGITGVYGPSGSGKSTLLNLISGLERPNEGSINILGKDVFNKESGIKIPENKRNIAYVFQEGRLFPHMTVMENLNFSLPYLKGRNQIIKFDEVVSLLDIKCLLEKKPRQLSGGERQRVAIGRALLSQPELLLLDEPFSNLDRYLRRQIISYLLKINTQFGIPMLLVSHVIGDILRLTNQILIVDNGRIPASGNVYDLMTNNAVPQIIRPRRYLNIQEACLKEIKPEEGLYYFGHVDWPDVQFATSARIAQNLKPEGKIRFAIRPDDIALSKSKVMNISIQNQLKGIVKRIIRTQESTFCAVDCGIELIVEVTDAAINSLELKENSEVYCLIKAKAIEIIHVY